MNVYSKEYHATNVIYEQQADTFWNWEAAEAFDFGLELALRYSSLTSGY